MDPDQTAPIGAVCSGSTLFASILNLSVMLGNYLQQTTSADDIFRCIFFLGALRVKIYQTGGGHWRRGRHFKQIMGRNSLFQLGFGPNGILRFLYHWFGPRKCMTLCLTLISPENVPKGDNQTILAGNCILSFPSSYIPFLNNGF